MDPCPFFRLVIANLGLKFQEDSANDYSCKITFKNHPPQFLKIPSSTHRPDDQQIHCFFTLSNSDLDSLIARSSSSTALTKPSYLKIEIYEETDGCGCGFNRRKALGSVSFPLDFRRVDSRGCVLHKGSVEVGRRRKGSSPPELHLDVRVEPDPRYVFEFGGAPECSPQVFQVKGNVKQSVFTCKFSFRTAAADGHARPLGLEPSVSRRWVRCLSSRRDQLAKERKGWTVTVHDLSGSPVAAASMVTPFVPSPGADHVSRTNPGAWLILRPAYGAWKPWGRLEAWREVPGDRVGYRFDLIPDGSIDAITLASSSVSARHGGRFAVDVTNGVSAVSSPGSSIDVGSWCGSYSEHGSGSAAAVFCRGFVMSSTVEREGKCGGPTVEIGASHVTCTEDAAAFVALAAAADLSMDACGLFTRKLRKELWQPGQE